ncbi:MAG: bi-domain-containing oxidoreductase [Kofleriaceae bacterium]
MKQVVQSLRTGVLSVEDVPAPLPRAGGVLVQTIASAVSAGTEKAKVELAKKNLVAKAIARPDQVQKVLATLRTEGVRATYQKIRNKLDALSPLGYSAAGRVVAVGDDCGQFAVGDLVACAGAGYANHAELIWVPENLCARIPEGVRGEHAAFATIGAIALHGVRQAEAKLGETIAVIGLGLIGQLTVQLLRASGCRVVGIDLDPAKVERAECDLGVVRDDRVVDRVLAFTERRGVDSVIITAAANTNDPIVLAGEIARDRAHVVIVGAVPAEIPRSPYYEKELDVRMSRSYGPGRYDRSYEDKGVAYPIGYVRWTEQRNLEAVLDAIATKRLDIERLITHRVSIDDATRAYDLVGASGSLGIVLTYPEVVARAPVSVSAVTARPLQLGLIGAGNFAGGVLLPILAEMPQVGLRSICTASGTRAKELATRFGFATAVGEIDGVIDDPQVTAVLIATRHDQHAALAERALAAGKAVFVEKPLAVDRESLARVFAAGTPMVGFNRRFSPHTARVVDAMRGPRVIQIRVNAGPIAADHWSHDDGGRVLGEGCHFIDLAQTLAAAPITRVFANGRRDDVVISLDFANGSVGTIAYTSIGDPATGKERIEVFGGGVTAVIDDFRTTTIGKQKWSTSQDKGHREELARFVSTVTHGAPPPIPRDELYRSSLAAIAVLEALATGAPITL